MYLNMSRLPASKVCCKSLCPSAIGVDVEALGKAANQLVERAVSNESSIREIHTIQ